MWETNCFSTQAIELLWWAVASHHFVVVCPSAGVGLEGVLVRCVGVEHCWEGDGDDADQCAEESGCNYEGVGWELLTWSVYLIRKACWRSPYIGYK